MIRFSLFTLGLVSLLLLPILAAEGGAPGPTPGAADVSAERARREALRQANRAKEEERLKKGGAPYLIHYIEPTFPLAAKGNFCALQVSIKIDEKGMVRGVLFQDEQPEPLFERAALEAIWQWRYSPRIVEGKAVRSDVFDVIKFFRPNKKNRSGADASRGCSGQAAATRHADRCATVARTVGRLRFQVRKMKRTLIIFALCEITCVAAARLLLLRRFAFSPLAR